MASQIFSLKFCCICSWFNTMKFVVVKSILHITIITEKKWLLSYKPCTSGVLWSISSWKKKKKNYYTPFDKELNFCNTFWINQGWHTKAYKDLILMIKKKQASDMIYFPKLLIEWDYNVHTTIHYDLCRIIISYYLLILPWLVFACTFLQTWIPSTLVPFLLLPIRLYPFLIIFVFFILEWEIKHQNWVNIN